MEWQYTGTRQHLTEKSVDALKPMVRHSVELAIILDPYAGSGSTLVAVALGGRHYLGIEFEPQYCESAQRRLEGVRRHLGPQR